MGTAGTARLKVHRRSFVVDGRWHTALSLRPVALRTAPRFATNRYHGTWHVLSSVEGAVLLGRLCWAMAHERREGTFAVIDPRFVVPNPFDADPSSPIVVVNNDLGPFDRTVAAALRRRLPFATPSEGTVVLHTSRLDHTLADVDAFWERTRRQQRDNSHQARRWIDRVSGLVVMAAPPPVLREWAVHLSRLGTHLRHGSSYIELDWSFGRGYEGEVQVFDDFAARVTRARIARERLFPGRAAEALSEDERAQVWAVPVATLPGGLSRNGVRAGG